MSQRRGRGAEIDSRLRQIDTRLRELKLSTGDHVPPQPQPFPEQLRPMAIALNLEPITRGVYFLVRDGLVVYVGQAVNVASRVGDHMRGPKDFDSCFYIPVPGNDAGYLNDIEGAFIRALSPPLCKQAPACRGNDNAVLRSFGMPEHSGEIAERIGLKAERQSLYRERSAMIIAAELAAEKAMQIRMSKAAARRAHRAPTQLQERGPWVDLLRDASRARREKRRRGRE